MRNPNGYGSVYKLSGNRRNPWIARITTGWEMVGDKPKQRYATLGYFPSRTKAIEALANFNQAPYDLTSNALTFADVYDKWTSEYFETITKSATRTIVSAYNHSAPLHNMKFRDIKAIHLEQTIKDAKVGQATKSRMKSMYNLMYKYALKNEICDKDYAQLVSVGLKANQSNIHEPFTMEELERLKTANMRYTDIIVFQCYTGLRPQELAIIKTEDVHLEENYFVGGIKTDAGRNRVIPIHHGIKPIIEKYYDKDKTYLFPCDTYDKYRHRFCDTMKDLGMSHKPHDPRTTFITMAKANQMDEYILKRIVGHHIEDVTENVYTRRSIEQLINEMEKLPY